jgi:hypothetical protein
MRTITRLALGAALIASAACVPLPPPGAAIVVVGPPPRRVEVVGVAPGPNFVWIRGHWVWGGRAYAWTPGRWAARPHPRARWVQGRWRRGRGGWFWVPGHWR